MKSARPPKVLKVAGTSEEMSGSHCGGADQPVVPLDNRETTLMIRRGWIG